MPPKGSKKRKLEEDSVDSAPKKATSSSSKGKGKSSNVSSKPESTSDKAEAPVDKKTAKGKGVSDEIQYRSYGDWKKAWGEHFHTKILKALWNARQQGSRPNDGSVFVVSYHKSGEYVEAEAKVLGVYTTAAAANEYAMGFFVDDLDAEGIVGPDDCSAVRQPFKGLEFSDDKSYWDVDDAGCWQLHGDEYKFGKFDLLVERKVLSTKPPARKEKSETGSETTGSETGWGESRPLSIDYF